MRTRFNETKLTQAAAYLLKLHGGEMKYIKLVKLLYLADRRSLLERGRTITKDHYVSMDHGPVLSIMLNLIQGSYRETDGTWAKTISTSNYDVVLNDAVGSLSIDNLSRAEIAILDGVYDEYGHWYRWTLIDEVMHKLPEWHHPAGSIIPIDYKDILRAGGLSESQQSLIEQEWDHLSDFDLMIAESSH